MNIEILHTDTCLADYWSGHHLAHLQIPIYPGMSLDEIKQSLRNEIALGVIAGNDDMALVLSDNPDYSDYEGYSEDQLVDAIYGAIDSIKPADPKTVSFFNDIEEPDEDSESVFAFFVIVDNDAE